MDKVNQGFRILNQVNLDDVLSESFRFYSKNLVEKMAEYEFDQQINADYYSRCLSRADSRNGYLPERKFLTSLGEITFRLRRARNIKIEYSFIGRYQRNTKKFDEMILKRVMLGSSYNDIVEMFDHSISSFKVQSIIRDLDHELVAFKSAPIEDNYKILFLDGRWFKVKSKNVVVLFALGVDDQGNKKILDFELSTSGGESIEAWERLLNRLYARGLKTPILIVHDRKAGLAPAIELVFPGSFQQNCIFHIMKNVIQRLKNIKNRRLFSLGLSSLFKISTFQGFQRKLKKFSRKWSDFEPLAVKYLADLDCKDTFTYLRFPKAFRKFIYTNNNIESYFSIAERKLHNHRDFFDIFSLERFIYLNILRYNAKFYKASADYIKYLKNLHKNY